MVTMTPLKTLRLPVLVALLAASSLRCSGDNIGPQPATTIAEAGGDEQAGTVGQPLPSPLVVLVTDDGGNPVPNVTVTWSAQGGGSVSATTVATGSSGRASVMRVLGPEPGEQTTTASAGSLDGSPVTFVAIAADAEGPSLALATQPSTAAQSGVAFAVQPIVQLKDADGNDLSESGVEVTVALASGTGTVGGTPTRPTDAAGKATFTDLSITGGPGVYTLGFTATGMNPAVSTSITLGAAAGSIIITTNPPASALTREVFDPSVQPEVVVEDGAGNPVVGSTVTARLATGSGTVQGTVTAITNASGVAKFADLGIEGTGEHTLELTTGTASVTSSPVNVSALPPGATRGEWGPVVDWDIVPLHMSLLPNGKIFAWGRAEVAVSDTMGMPRIWDPATQASPNGLPQIHVDDMLFCAGHTLMPDGRLMVNGGHHKDAAGIKVTYFFSQDGAPQKSLDMKHGRWYPTLTVLPNGDVLTMAGRNEAGSVVTMSELWNGSSWVELTGGPLRLPYYPRNFVDPVREGRVFYAGEQVASRWFDYGGTGSWTSGPQHIWKFNREYGTAVMYDTGKILYAGGGGDRGWACECPDSEKSATPTATAEKIDLNQTSPQWQSAGSMSAPRRHLNSTILPDGQVLITGGTRAGGFVNINEGMAVKEAEVWNPSTGEWTTLAENSVMRTYHSVSLLLPDGKVLHGASGDALIGDGVTPMPREKNHEIFSPPYLFKGARPSITSASPSVGYGQTFSVATPNAAQITDARWIRLGSVTHAFDMSQRANTLTFTRTANGVEITAPADPKLAPPGHYMLFVLNRNGVPSEGRIIRVQ